jgi:hypothetical protein
MVCTPLVGTIADGSTVSVGWVCGPGQMYRRFYQHCEGCGRNRRWVARNDGLYYGETEMCCACGATWQDGCQLRTYPESVTTARRWWSEAVTPQQYNAAVRGEIADVFGDES